MVFVILSAILLLGKNQRQPVVDHEILRSTLQLTLWPSAVNAGVGQIEGTVTVCNILHALFLFSLALLSI